MSAISTKNLSCWGLNNVGTRFSAGLSGNRWTPSSGVLVLYSDPLSCNQIREILSMFIILSFFASTASVVGDLEFPLFGNFG